MREAKYVLKQGVLLFLFIMTVTILLQYYQFYMQGYSGLEKIISDSSSNVLAVDSEEEDR